LNVVSANSSDFLSMKTALSEIIFSYFIYLLYKNFLGLTRYSTTNINCTEQVDDGGAVPKLAQAAQMGEHFTSGYKFQHHVEVTVVLQYSLL
jgi:hypothetical protein